MSENFEKIKLLVQQREVQVSEHASIEMEKDDILVDELLDSIETTELLEDYPDHPRGPCMLLMHKTSKARRLHAVWGIPAGYSSPTVLVTSYVPDPGLWDGNPRTRRS